MAQTTQNLPETDPTIQIPYLEEVEVTKEKFDLATWSNSPILISKVPNMTW